MNLVMEENQTICLLVRQINEGSIPYHIDPKGSWELLTKLVEATNNYWHWWSSFCKYKGRWREIVLRSALALKLLTYAPTGAILASPTTSLPEVIGGGLNWDYRFTWIRDAAFTVYAFLRIGFKDEAKAFMKWIENVAMSMDPVQGLNILYTIDGTIPLNTEHLGTQTTNPIEMELTHWEGYRNSKPVRIGNAAFHQTQLDIYGELLDAIYLSDKYCEPISYHFWTIIRDKIVPFILKNWQKPDHSIWENREPMKHHVYSKIMLWVALDRSVRLAFKRSLPAPDISEWIYTRDILKEEILQKGWNSELETFVQSYGSERMDASNLIMPLVFFIAPTDPLFLKTLIVPYVPQSMEDLL